MDFKLGIDNASAAMIREHMEKNEDKHQMKELVKRMHKNDFFKLFVGKYQKSLSRALENPGDHQTGEAGNK